MSLLDNAVNRFRSTACLMLMIVIMGIAARAAMTVESSPEVSPPIIIVQVRHEGISPEDGVRLLIRPLEQEIRPLEGVEEVVATARESLVYLVIEFDSAMDVDLAVDEVRNAVSTCSIATLIRSAAEP